MEGGAYAVEIAAPGLMRNCVTRKRGIHFPPEHKLNRFLTAAMRVYRMPEKEREQV